MVGEAKTQQDEHEVGEWMQLPEILSGKKILEVCSGADDLSLREAFLRRGAQYFSLDKNERASGDHVFGDAWQMPYPNGAFDIVVASGPLIWGRYISGADEATGNSHLINEEKSLTFIGECLRVLSDNPGSELKISHGFTLKDLAWLRRNIGFQIEDFDSHFEMISTHTDDQDSDRYGVKIPNQYTYALTIVRK